MQTAAAILDAFDQPALLLQADGSAQANAAFNALDVSEQARAGSGEHADWKASLLPDGSRLLVRAEAAGSRLLARERFLATLSHEIRTPLNGVLGMAGLLSRTRLDATQKDYLAALRASGEHLLGLVNDVLDFAKLDAGRIELELAPTDLEQLLQGVCELLSPRATAQGIEIAWCAEPGLPSVLTDDGRLRQILFNLAGNAVKLTKAGGVLLSAERCGPSGADGDLTLRFRVRDTGPGLAAEAQARVFEEFVQTEEGARVGGAGLGLAIVKRLAEAFDGRVGVDSVEGQGADFWFEAAFTPTGPGRPHEELAGLSVAVVSASVIVREAACGQVRACAGAALAYATLAEAEAHAPSRAVILVDPVDVQRRRIPPPPKGRPALVLLAPEERSAIARYRAAGYAGYLIKPLRRTSLAARVLAALQGADRAEPAAAPGGSDDERAAPAGAWGARVLLAEDNPVNALLARALLAREGCSVERVATGEEALAALDAANVAGSPYDVVLMDMRMPVLDGLAATRALRARGYRTPVVALTANAFEDDRRACLDAGMNDFLTKPIEPGALRAALARWTSSPGEAKLAC